MKLLNTISVITLAAVASYGCSSSGGGSAPTPNGIYTGTITDGLGAPTNGNEKGIFYDNRLMVFSTSANIQQLFDAETTTNSSNFSGTVSNYDNTNTTKRFIADISGSFIENTSVTASFNNFSPDIFNPGTINLMANNTLYEKGSSTSSVTGSWQGIYGGAAETASLSIDAMGGIAGSDTERCNFTGTIAPADPSVNVYNVTLVSTGGAGCTSLPTATYTGFAWTEGASDTTLNFTVANGTNSRSVVLTKN